MVRVAAVDQAGNELRTSFTPPVMVAANQAGATPLAGTPTR
jgi:hypothetical protein